MVETATATGLINQANPNTSLTADAAAREAALKSGAVASKVSSDTSVETKTISGGVQNIINKFDTEIANTFDKYLHNPEKFLKSIDVPAMSNDEKFALREFLKSKGSAYAPLAESALLKDAQASKMGEQILNVAHSAYGFNYSTDHYDWQKGGASSKEAFGFIKNLQSVAQIEAFKLSIEHLYGYKAVDRVYDKIATVSEDRKNGVSNVQQRSLDILSGRSGFVDSISTETHAATHKPKHTKHHTAHKEESTTKPTTAPVADKVDPSPAPTPTGPRNAVEAATGVSTTAKKAPLGSGSSIPKSELDEAIAKATAAQNQKIADLQKTLDALLAEKTGKPAPAIQAATQPVIAPAAAASVTPGVHTAVAIPPSTTRPIDRALNELGTPTHIVPPKNYVELNPEQKLEMDRASAAKAAAAAEAAAAIDRQAKVDNARYNGVTHLINITRDQAAIRAIALDRDMTPDQRKEAMNRIYEARCKEQDVGHGPIDTVLMRRNGIFQTVRHDLKVAYDTINQDDLSAMKLTDKQLVNIRKGQDAIADLGWGGVALRENSQFVKLTTDNIDVRAAKEVAAMYKSGNISQAQQDVIEKKFDLQGWDNSGHRDRVSLIAGSMVIVDPDFEKKLSTMTASQRDQLLHDLRMFRFDGNNDLERAVARGSVVSVKEKAEKVLKEYPL